MRALNVLKYLSGALGLVFGCGAFIALGIRGISIPVATIYVLACLSLLFDRRWSEVLGLLLFSGLFTSFAIGLAHYCDQTNGNPKGCLSKIADYFLDNHLLDLVYIAHVFASISLLVMSALRKRETRYS